MFRATLTLRRERRARRLPDNLHEPAIQTFSLSRLEHLGHGPTPVVDSSALALGAHPRGNRERALLERHADAVLRCDGPTCTILAVGLRTSNPVADLRVHENARAPPACGDRCSPRRLLRCVARNPLTAIIRRQSVRATRSWCLRRREEGRRSRGDGGNDCDDRGDDGCDDRRQLVNRAQRSVTA